MTDEKPLYIRDNATGEIRQSKWQDSPREFWWTEGNGGCDCNRALAFGLHEADEDDFPCSHDRFDLVNADGSPFTSWAREDDHAHA